jgi:hypothetical protein
MIEFGRMARKSRLREPKRASRAAGTRTLPKRAERNKDKFLGVLKGIIRTTGSA